jgi:His Kinase A (phospho-acceptor) domain
MTTIPTTPGAIPGTPRLEAGGALDEFEALYDLLLYVVSHDLKSPLLSISLGAELLAAGPGGASALDERTRLGLDSVTRGTQDLTRLLDAVTLVSRARRRPLDATPVALASALPGLPRTAGLEDTRVAVDARVLAEIVAALGGESAAAGAQVRPGDSEVRLVLPWPTGAPGCDGAPLEALLNSLTVHAGTVVGTLAALQVQLERQGGTLVVSTAGGGHATVLLPRA